ncbi:MAG: VCBS domain-containing protein, partial [Endozoicomonas sp.]
MHSDSGSSRPVIGHLAEASGTVVAVAPDGSKRTLEAGDTLYLHDRVFTEPGHTASIELLNGQPLLIDGHTRLVLVKSMLHSSDSSNEDSSEEDLDRVLDEALSEDESPPLRNGAEFWDGDDSNKTSTKDIPRMPLVGHEEAIGQAEVDEEYSSNLLSNLKTLQLSNEDEQVFIGQLLTRTSGPGENLVFSLISEPEAGSLSLDSSGSFQFNPGDDFHHLGANETEVVVFTFLIKDSLGNQEEAEVEITVTGENDAPEVTSPVEASPPQEYDAFTLNLLQHARDQDENDELLVRNLRLITGNETGVHVGIDGSSLIIDPMSYRFLADGESETLTYEYEVSDSLESVRQTATITLSGINDAPEVTQAILETTDEEAGTVTIDLLEGVSDIDSTDSLEAVSLRLTAGDPAGVTVKPDDNSLEIDITAYEHLADGEAETIEYEYEVEDDQGEAVTQQATIVIEGRNDAPEDIDLSSSSIMENDAGAVVGTLSTTDKDLSDTHVYTVSDNRFEVVGNQLRLKAAESLDHEKEDTVTVIITSEDSNGASYTESFTINVGDINEKPVSTDSSATIDEETLYRFLLTNFIFTDEDDGDSLSFVKIDTLPDSGALELNGTVVAAGDHIQLSDITAGNLTFLPDNRESGNNYASLQFRVSDGNLLSEGQTFTFNVTPIANTPSLVLAAAVVNSVEDTPVPLGITSSLSDSDGSESLTLTLSGIPSGSTITDGNNSIHSDGSDLDISSWQLSTLQLVPPANSTTGFTLTVTASTTESGNSDSASVSRTLAVNLTPADDAPTAGDVDLGITVEENDFIISEAALLATASDIDTDPLSVTSAILDNAAHGILTDNLDGTWTFSPATDFNGTDITFSFTVSDGTPGDEVTATATLDVTPDNDAPDPVDDISAGEVTVGGSAVSGSSSVLDNDSDVEDDTLTVNHVNGTAVTASGSVITGSYGNLTIGTDGNWSYTPKASLPGGGQTNTTLVDQFTYTVSDGEDSASATLSVNVNRSPEAQSGTLTATEDDASASGNLSALDRDIGDTLTYSKETDPSEGTVSVNTDGSYQFTPGSDFQDLAQGESRTATFSYRVTDSNGDYDTAQVSITVSGANDAPSAIALSGSTVDENDAGAVIGQLTVTDADASNTHSFSVDDSRFEVVSGQLKLKDGISLNHESASTLAVNVTATDDQSAQKVQTFTITVVDQNEAPELTATVSSSITEDTGTQTVSLLTGATDQDGDTLSISNLVKASGDASGVTVDGTNLKVDTSAYQSLGDGVIETLTYTYDISDGNGGTVSQSASIIITGTNDEAVIFGMSTGSLTEDTDVNVDGDLIATGTLSITDADSGEGSFDANTHHGTYGTLVIVSNGQWTYTASNSSSAIQSLADGSTLTDSIQVSALDGTQQTVTITITGTNDSPVISGAASGSVTEDTLVDAVGKITASGTLTVTDPDIGQSSFTAETVTGSYGSLVIAADGSWDYSADNSQSVIQNLGISETLTDSFTVTT